MKIHSEKRSSIKEILLKDTSISQKEEQISKLLAFSPEEIECEISDSESENSLYLNNLNPLTLNNSFYDFYKILEVISNKNPNKDINICDIGSAYSKLAMIADWFFPNVTIVSIEPVRERVDYAKNFVSERHEFINDYFSSEYLNKNIDFVFLYFPVCDALEDIINTVKVPIIAIESHGDLIYRLGHSFNSKETLLRTAIERHDQNVYLFSGKKDSEIYSRTKAILDGKYVIIDDWIATTTCAAMYFDDPEIITIQFKYPPRTVYTNENISQIEEKDISAKVRTLCKLREDDFEFGVHKIRKIFLDGSYELSSGEIKKPT